ncbi:hypothetical protein BU16DRAFT_29835 [Lophium mytilinum]|uniref:Tat pathway signal sequence n=1 Tax=Lophium mytilinum TaxID=390894 RepID=A0A6A6REC6_9PEZI|nr:hypothetical protein BU16DRAFT_29835 [Lophium mytilinum]
MDHRAFHEKAKTLKPDQEIASRRYWVGILKHDLTEPDPSTEADFLWIKAHAKITVQVLTSEYEKRFCSDISLELDNEAPTHSTPLAALNTYGDNIIIFRAVLKTAAPRPALQPVNRQLTAEPQLQLTSPSNAKALLTSPAVPDSAPTTNNATTDENIVEGPPESTGQSTAQTGLRDATTSQAVRSSTPDMGPMVSRPKSPQDTKPQIKNEQEDLRPGVSGLDSAGDSIMAEATQMKDESPELEPAPTPSTEHLLRLMDDASPDILEVGVRRAMNLLNNLQETFSTNAGVVQDAQQWLASIDNVRKLAIRQRTVVGVVGNTGAGKSSVINAMLDEERLVPTNCMRACTAVVTEMSWNDSKDDRKKYSAAIEFISKADWEKEMSVLLKDLLGPDGEVSRDCTDPDSEAGVAWAKFKAVFPQKTKDMLAGSTVESLLKDKSVLSVLGTTRKIVESQPERFYSRLQHYVDSKEKDTKVAGKYAEKKKEKKTMEFWPLIKVVKIYTKSPALSTGAVIVDLPGVHDSNAARSAVAQGYMKQCTGLWIVAPINRAVDDKAAKSLLGDSFKRQLKYDGTYSNVTFICSKTDDISITEAADSLGLDKEISEFDQEERSLNHQVKDLEEKISELQESKQIYTEIIEEMDDQLETWGTIEDDVQDGRTVYPPKSKGKRKRNASPAKSRKRRDRTPDSDDDDDFDVRSGSDDPNGEQSDDENQTDCTPLTEEQVHDKINELRDTKKNARAQKRETDVDIKAARQNIRQLKEKRADVKAKMSAICIAGRNQYSKGAIQQDFAAGIKELDQENAMEQDEENFNPDEDIRDYDHVARSLPVFCVSSRAYQKLCGRLKKDAPVPGFTSMDETEIPQLQAHCKKLTEAGRASTCRTFLNNLSQLLTSLNLWSSNDGSGINFTDEDRRKQAHFLHRKLEELRKGLEKSVTACATEMKHSLTENVYDKYDEAIEEAATNAVPTAARWSAHKNDGGLHWGTYRATVRRDGVFAGSKGLRDFNAELAEPITKRLASGWERAFQRRLPHALQTYTRVSYNNLLTFHKTMETRAQLVGTATHGLVILAQQLPTYQKSFTDLAGAMAQIMTEWQRDANREFTPVIAAAMQTGYENCSSQVGTGMFVRMKGIMAGHVEQEKNSMFRDATDTVKERLSKMVETVDESMRERGDAIFENMRRDYMAILGGVHIRPGEVMPRAERMLRKNVLDFLLSADDHFKAVLDGEVDEIVEEAKDEPAEEDKESDFEEMQDDDEDMDDVNDDETASRAASAATGPSNSHEETSRNDNSTRVSDFGYSAPKSTVPSVAPSTVPSVAPSALPDVADD